MDETLLNQQVDDCPPDWVTSDVFKEGKLEIHTVMLNHADYTLTWAINYDL